MSAAERNALIHHALREVVTWGRLMRDRQAEYFKTRDREVLIASKAAERSFDAALIHAERLLTTEAV